MILPQNLEEIKPLRQWVNYILIWNPTKKEGKGGYDKPPINPKTLRDGMTNNPETWADYESTAVNVGKPAIHKDTKHKDSEGNFPVVKAPVEGSGLVLCNGYCGVDLDDVIDDEGHLAPFAAEIVKRLDTYTELSPSGSGLHCLLYCEDLLKSAKAEKKKVYDESVAAGLSQEEALKKANVAGDFGTGFYLNCEGNITDKKHKAYELEVYFYAAGGRYFTVTGNVYIDRPINRTKGKELRAIFDEYTAKKTAYNSAGRPSVPAVKSLSPRSKETTAEGSRKMVESALKAIRPADLNGYDEWAPIMSALCEMGYSYDYAEQWSSGQLSNTSNPINNPVSNEHRWSRGNFRLKGGSLGAEGIIINAAKRFDWKPSDSFEDAERREYGKSLHSQEERTAYGRSLHSEEERRAYGRSLYSEEERREYGKRKHKERLDAAWEDHKDDFQEWLSRRKSTESDPERDPEQQQAKTSQYMRMTAEDFRKWFKGRKKNA